MNDSAPDESGERSTGTCTQISRQGSLSWGKVMPARSGFAAPLTVRGGGKHDHHRDEGHKPLSS